MIIQPLPSTVGASENEDRVKHLESSLMVARRNFAEIQKQGVTGRNLNSDLRDASETIYQRDDPAFLTTSVNNWNLDTQKTIFYVDAISAVNVTGIANGVEGKHISLINQGSSSITLKHEDEGSTAANRFKFSSGADIVLSADRALQLVYDGRAARWRDYFLPTGGGGAVSGSGVAGQVAYWSSGSAVAGNNAHFWDTATLRLGLSTTTPRRTLDVLSTAAAQVRLTYSDNTNFTDLETDSAGYLRINPSGGRVGINMLTPPTAALDVNGVLNYTTIVTFRSATVLSSVGVSGHFRLCDDSFWSEVQLGGNTIPPGQFVTIYSDSIETVRVTGTQVGIGEDIPARKLHVTDNSGPQLRLAYDDPNFVDLETDFTGDLYVKPVGGSLYVKTTTLDSEIFIDADPGDYSVLYLSASEVVKWAIYRNATTHDFRIDSESDTIAYIVQSTGRFGHRTITPRKTVDILSTTEAQLRLTYTDNSIFADFLVDSAGALSITTSGSSVKLPYITAGSVLYGGTGGSISQNNAAFFWDNTRPKLTITSTTGSALGANLNIVSNDNASNDSTGIGLIKGSGQGAVGISWQNSSGAGIWDQDLLHGVDDFIVRSGTASKWSIAQYGAGAFGGDGETGTGSWGVVLQVDSSGFTHVRGNTGHDARLHLEATDDTSNVQIIYTRNSATKWKGGVEASTNNFIWSNATQVMMRLGSTGLLNVLATASAQEGIRLSGQDFLNLSSDTGGPCFLNYVNAVGNRQLGIADSASLASSSTNPVFRFQPNGKQFDCVSTNATQLSFTIGVTNQIFVHSGGNVGVNVSPSVRLHVLDTSTQARFAYDGSNYADVKVTSGGILDITPTGSIVEIVNGTTAQALRVYGTTSSSKYSTVRHDGTDSFFENSSGFTTLGATGGAITFAHTGTANLWQISVGNGYRFAAQGNYGITHGTSALATTATEGHFMIQSCAGAPTGVPANIPTGQVPMVVDTTNDRLYIYYDDGGGAGWHYFARTA